jgi:hypothetical protein
VIPPGRVTAAAWSPAPGPGGHPVTLGPPGRARVAPPAWHRHGVRLMIPGPAASASGTVSRTVTGQLEVRVTGTAGSGSGDHSRRRRASPSHGWAPPAGRRASDSDVRLGLALTQARTPPGRRIAEPADSPAQGRLGRPLPGRGQAVPGRDRPGRAAPADGLHAGGGPCRVVARAVPGSRRRRAGDAAATTSRTFNVRPPRQQARHLIMMGAGPQRAGLRRGRFALAAGSERRPGPWRAHRRRRRIG